MWAAGNMRGARAAGFSLLEMLVILGIVSLLAGLAFPSIDKAMERQSFIASAMRLETALRAARAAAIRSGTTVRLAVTPDQRAVRYGDRQELFTAPLRLTVPGNGIVFFADGSASGGQVALTDGRRMQRWTVRAASGAIEGQP